MKQISPFQLIAIAWIAHSFTASAQPVNIPSVPISRHTELKGKGRVEVLHRAEHPGGDYRRAAEIEMNVDFQSDSADPSGQIVLRNLEGPRLPSLNNDKDVHIDRLEFITSYVVGKYNRTAIVKGRIKKRPQLRFWMLVADNRLIRRAPPGRDQGTADMVSILITDLKGNAVFCISGPLTAGNLEVHPMN